MKFLYNFFKRFLTEVSDLYHVILGSADKIFNSINAGTLQAIEASYRQVKLLNGHLKDSCLFSHLVLDHELTVLCLVRYIDKQVEMLVEYLGSERNCFFSSDSTVGDNVKRKLIKVSYVADTGILNVEACFIYRRIDRVGKY